MKSIRSWILLSILIHLIVIILISINGNQTKKTYKEKKIAFDLLPEGQQNLHPQKKTIPQSLPTPTIPQKQRKEVPPEKKEQSTKSITSEKNENQENQMDEPVTRDNGVRLPENFMLKNPKQKKAPNPSLKYGNRKEGEENGWSDEMDTESEGNNITGDVTFDVTDFDDFLKYKRHVIRKVRRNWHAPYAFHLGLLSGSSKISFRIQKDGSITVPSLLDSSNHESLDIAAINAIKASAKFKPLPDDFPEEDLGVRFTFNYLIVDNQQ